MIRAIRVSHRKAKGATCRARARKGGLTRESNKPPVVALASFRNLPATRRFASDGRCNTTFQDSDDSRHSSSINDDNPGACRLPSRARPRPRATRLPARCDACLPHAWPPRLVARIRTDERVPRGLLPGVRPQLSTAPRPRTMHMTTTDSLEHDKRSHQTNNRRFKPVPVRTHHSHTRTNSRSSVVATEHTPAN